MLYTNFAKYEILICRGRPAAFSAFDKAFALSPAKPKDSIAAGFYLIDKMPCIRVNKSRRPVCWQAELHAVKAEGTVAVRYIHFEI